MTKSLTEQYWNLTEQEMQRLRFERRGLGDWHIPETLDEVRKRCLDRMADWLMTSASSGRPTPLPPAEKRRKAFEAVAAEELIAKRSALAGCPMRLVSYGGRHAFVAELPDRRLAALGERDWHEVSAAELAEPYWDDWWQRGAHSPTAALEVLATTLVYYRSIADEERKWLQLVLQRSLPPRPFDSMPQRESLEYL